MALPPDILRYPPFPPLTWKDGDWWEGNTRWAAWAGFLSRNGVYGAKDSDAPADGDALLNLTPPDPETSRLPSRAQCRAYSYQQEHGEEVVDSVLMALGTYYRELRPKLEAHHDPETLGRIMPPIAEPTDFRRLIGLSQIHIHPWQKEAMSYVGLEFGCAWDEEHGFGAMLHGSRVVAIGSADVSFAWEPEEADYS